MPFPGETYTFQFIEMCHACLNITLVAVLFYIFFPEYSNF